MFEISWVFREEYCCACYVIFSEEYLVNKGEGEDEDAVRFL